MVKLKHKDIRTIDDAFGMHGGYVLNFSDRTFSEFFEDEFGLDIDDDRYDLNGTSKAKRLRTFLSLENDFTVAKVLRELWAYRETLPAPQGWDKPQSEDCVKARLFDLIRRIEANSSSPRMDAFDKFAADETLEELIADIERDIQANKPAAALDRLHTYSMKKLAHLIERRGGSCNRDDRLHSRMGKYIKLLERNREFREISKRALKSGISIFESFNDVRNNESLAHDNDIVDHAEARYIFDTITALLRFIKTIEAEKFGR